MDKVTFKKFNTFMSITDESLSEEQLNELWPFTNQDKKNELEQKRRDLIKKDFELRRDIQKQREEERRAKLNKRTPNTASSKLDSTSPKDMTGAQRRAVDRDPFGTK